MPSNKSFGLVFSFLFFVLLLYDFFLKDLINYIYLLLSLVFLILGLANSKILSPFNKLWINFGYFLGKTLGPIIMILIYFFGVFMTRLFLIIIKKDPLKLELKDDINSYWETSDKKINKSMNDQF